MICLYRADIIGLDNLRRIEMNKLSPDIVQSTYTHDNFVLSKNVVK